jgi:hypothetical protein
VAQVVVQPGDIGPGHVRDPVPAQRRQDEAPEVAALLAGGAGLDPMRDVPPVEALGEVPDRDRPAVGVASGGRVLAVPGRGDDGKRVRAYLDMTGAERGLIVLMTSGAVIPVRPTNPPSRYSENRAA